jgi:hypothetical protein
MQSMYKKKIFLLLVSEADDLDKNILNKLNEEVFPTNVLSFELSTGTNNILIPRKRSIFDIIPPLLKDIINYPCSEYKSLMLNCDKPLIFNLFKGSIAIDLNKSVAKSPLLSDDRLFDFSPIMSVRPGPELTQDHYIKDGL